MAHGECHVHRRVALAPGGDEPDFVQHHRKHRLSTPAADQVRFRVLVVANARLGTGSEEGDGEMIAEFEPCSVMFTPPSVGICAGWTWVKFGGAYANGAIVDWPFTSTCKKFAPSPPRPICDAAA